MLWDPQVLSWTSTGEFRDEERWHFKSLLVFENLQCKLPTMRLLHEESLETIVIFQSVFKFFQKIGLPGISLCNYSFCLFAPYLFFLWPVLSLPKLISHFFLRENKTCKTVSFLGLLVSKTCSVLWHENKFSSRFSTFAILLSFMVLNIIRRLYTVLLTIWSCAHKTHDYMYTCINRTHACALRTYATISVVSGPKSFCMNLWLNS